MKMKLVILMKTKMRSGSASKATLFSYLDQTTNLETTFYR
jgi:hypothetical protein